MLICEWRGKLPRMATVSPCLRYLLFRVLRVELVSCVSNVLRLRCPVVELSKGDETPSVWFLGPNRSLKEFHVHL